jgi:hypothetical protein
MAGEGGPPAGPEPPADHYVLDDADSDRVVLGDLINRVLDKGVVISGHVTISVADIDLIALDLRLLVTSIQTAIDRAGVGSSPRDDDADVPVLPADVRAER